MSSITYSEQIKIETFCELGLSNIQMGVRLNRSPSTISYELSKLYQDADVSKKSGIFEYVLSGQKSEFIKLLSIRAFSETDKRTVYKQQTTAAQAAGISNCPYCVTDTEYDHKTHIWTFKEMEGDHITPWSKGGKTEIANLQMLCKHHNGMKTNN